LSDPNKVISPIAPFLWILSFNTTFKFQEPRKTAKAVIGLPVTFQVLLIVFGNGGISGYILELITSPSRIWTWCFVWRVKLVVPKPISTLHSICRDSWASEFISSIPSSMPKLELKWILFPQTVTHIIQHGNLILLSQKNYIEITLGRCERKRSR
jgi:hypothetical protein